jgi:hypothetical protein
MMRWIALVLTMISIASAQSFPPDSVWTFAYDHGGDEYFYDAIQVEDGYLLCGEAREWNALAGLPLLLKLDFEGNLVWAQTYADSGFARFTQIEYGYFDNGGFMLEKTDEAGNATNIVEMECGGGSDVYFRTMQHWCCFDNSHQGYFWLLTEGDYYAELAAYSGRRADSTYENYSATYSVRDNSHNNSDARVFTREGTDVCLGGLRADYDVWQFGKSSFGDSNQFYCSLIRSMSTWAPNPGFYGASNILTELGEGAFNGGVVGPSESSFVLTGCNTPDGYATKQLLVAKFDIPSTTPTWTVSFGGLAYESGVAVVNGDDSGYVVAGNFSSEDIDFEQSDFWLLKVSDTGDSVWSVVKGGEEADKCEGMIRTHNGFLLFGESQSYAVPGWDGCAMLLAYVPDIAAAPGSMNFGPVSVGNSVTRSLGLINTGSNVLTVHEIIGTESYSATFAGPATVAIGDTLRVDVVFAPQNPGTFIDTLQVLSDAITGVKYVRCIGAGTAASGDNSAPLPTDYSLHKAYPNPFNPSTTISFELSQDSHAELEIFDVQGRVVETLFDGELSAGTHSRVWSCGTCAGGVYFARLRASEFVGIQKLVLMK